MGTSVTVTFYLGTHRPNWLSMEPGLMVSRRVLTGRRTFPQAPAPWILDSGGFTELSMNGAWGITPAAYAKEIVRYQEEIGNLEWAAPMDWMCEDFVLGKTGLTIEAHQNKTVANFLELRSLLGDTTVIPVLQGFSLDDYQTCIQKYEDAGVNLSNEATVGLGSVCRRSQTGEAIGIVRSLSEEIGNRIHGFGLKGDTILALKSTLKSSDSMAWSAAGRRDRLNGCTHKSCANCLRYARRWRTTLNERLGQEELCLA